MGKGGNSKKKESGGPKKRTKNDYVAPEDMDDEIDAFHKQRDVIPLDINGDIEDSEEDTEERVFDIEGIDDDEDDDDDDMDDETQLTGLAAKISKQQKYLRAKTGGVEDEMHDDADEDEERKPDTWGRGKNIYYSADNIDYELQSSDEELAAEEEAEVLRLQREKAKSYSMEDFGLEDEDHDDGDEEPTLGEIMIKGKAAPKPLTEKEGEDGTDIMYEEVKKDINALSREEQMDVVYSAAPELVGLLSELNVALEELESRVNPLLSMVKVKEGENTRKGGMHYLEVKQLLLLAYCQAIAFYLLLKSEGQPIRDHPVIARLVEIKNLLDKTKQLDMNLPSELEKILEQNLGTEAVAKLDTQMSVFTSDSPTKAPELSLVSDKTRKAAQKLQPHETPEVVKMDSTEDNAKKGGKRKRENEQVSRQSKEMLKLRGALEEKLKQKGIYSSSTGENPDKAKKLQSKPVNNQLETLNDFDDEAIDVHRATRGLSNGHASSFTSAKLSQLINATKGTKFKVISGGDDDLPKRDDIGERRRKHELRVLAGAGIYSADDSGEEPTKNGGDHEVEDSKDDFYKQIEQERAAKLAVKAERYSRTPVIPAEVEIPADGRRKIDQKIEKNRGLTRPRKKLIKNPRKKYKLKHQKAVIRRKGQVRDIMKPTGSYGGEVSGINAGISRSIRFKN